jgi:hypothetical protein
MPLSCGSTPCILVLPLFVPTGWGPRRDRCVGVIAQAGTQTRGLNGEIRPTNESAALLNVQGVRLTLPDRPAEIQ